jgi:hypothetical protein
VAVVDALGIALEEKTRAKTAILCAVAHSCPFIDPDAVKETIREKLSVRNAHLVEAARHRPADHVAIVTPASTWLVMSSRWAAITGQVTCGSLASASSDGVPVAGVGLGAQHLCGPLEVAALGQQVG